MKNISTLILFVVSLFLVTGCRDFLDEKSDAQLAIPETLADQQALLDNLGFLNTEFTSAAAISADDYYLTDAQFNAIPFEENKRLYQWMPDHVAKSSSLGNNWQTCYRAIYICNMTLYTINDKEFTGPEADNVRGQALALRAARYLDAAQVWCQVYDVQTAEQSLGLPLRLDPDMSIPSVRASLKETYAQIITDLQAASMLLPSKQISRMRMSRDAAYGLLARTYLYMGDYENALAYAQKALNITSTLMDFSSLDLSSNYPVPNLNEEILFWCATTYESTLMQAKINREFYNKYDDNDLRKEVFFNINSANEVVFSGFYNRTNGPNPGVAVDELYLIKAECEARLNNIPAAMVSLNTLLKTRWKPETYVLFSATNPTEAQVLIRQEREKELLVRGIRWADLKRYNRDGANIVLRRTVNGAVYELPPNDLRYAIAIPEEVIKIAGIPQNPR